MTAPTPLQAVLLFQHHQTTTPYAPQAGASGTGKQSPVQEKEAEQEQEEDDEEEQGDEEEDDDA